MKGDNMKRALLISSYIFTHCCPVSVKIDVA